MARRRRFFRNWSFKDYVILVLVLPILLVFVASAFLFTIVTLPLVLVATRKLYMVLVASPSVWKTVDELAKETETPKWLIKCSLDVLVPEYVFSELSEELLPIDMKEERKERLRRRLPYTKTFEYYKYRIKHTRGRKRFQIPNLVRVFGAPLRA